ncbi:MAG: hypothetical protein SNJ71_05575 [Bacteroidales bacterium]
MENKLNLTKSLLETSKNPTITYGGKSSSSALNSINENVKEDIQNLDIAVKSLQDKVIQNRALIIEQSSALANYAAGLKNILKTIKETNSNWTVIDFYNSEDYIDTNNTCSINKKYGQATLSILSEVDWLISKDLENNVLIPLGTTLEYATGSNLNTRPSEFMINNDYEYALDNTYGTMWITDVTENDIFWVKCSVPVNSVTSGFANCIEISPFPLLQHTLQKVEIITQTGTTITLNASDLSYQPGYNINNNSIENIADIRIFFQPAKVKEVYLKFKCGGNLFGLSNIAIKTVTFSAASNLILNINKLWSDILDLTINTPVMKLHGKDSTELNKIPYTLSGSKVTYGLSQQQSMMSPVITMLEIKKSS